MLQPASRQSRARGQALVLFVLTLTAMIGLTGLVIDGSSTYVQRRGMQNAADLAAMAAGYACINNLAGNLTVMPLPPCTTGPNDLTLAADAVAAANGYPTSINTMVIVTATPTNGNTAAQITVSITAPHQNWFSGIFGMASWNVGTTAAVLAGIPNEVAGGALPLLFNADQCSVRAGSGSACGTGTKDNPATFNEPPSGPQTIPLDNLTSGYFEFNWTVFCQANGNPCNANTNLVNGLITGTSPTSQVTITLGDLIGPLNAGSHTQLFSALAPFVGGCYPVAMVANNGALQGFATFCLTSSVGGSTKQISGYFPSGWTGQNLMIAPNGGTPAFYGTYAINLVN